METVRALALLGLSRIQLHRLGLPDGHLADLEAPMTWALVPQLRPSDVVITTWRHDGHPDHEATGRACAAACAQVGATLLEMPISAWHWARPGDPRLPWARACRPRGRARWSPSGSRGGRRCWWPGPPADRALLVLALLEAGVIRLLGPGMTITADEDRGLLRASSPLTGEVVDARVLLETRMSKGRVTDTDDPLLRALLDSGRARIHTVDAVPTHSLETSLAERSEDARGGFNLVAADGSIDPSVVVLGIPAASTQPGSAIGATPGVPSPLLAGADVAARQIVARAQMSRNVSICAPSPFSRSARSS